MDPSRGGGGGGGDGGGGAGPPGDGNDQMCVRRGVRVPVVRCLSCAVLAGRTGFRRVPVGGRFRGFRWTDGGRGIEGRFGVGFSD
jgi:hypothetical protein